MARPERFELPTKWFEATYSIQLSYGRTCLQSLCLEKANRSGGYNTQAASWCLVFSSKLLRSSYIPLNQKVFITAIHHTDNSDSASSQKKKRFRWVMLGLPPALSTQRKYMLLRKPASTKKLATTGRASCHVERGLPACFI